MNLHYNKPNIYLGRSYLLEKNCNKVKYFKGHTVKQMLRISLQGILAKIDELCIYQCSKHELRIFMEPLNRKLELTKGKLAAHLMVNLHFSSDQISQKFQVTQFAKKYILHKMKTTDTS